MNRTIKFRAKCLESGRWVYGSLLQDDYGTYQFVDFIDHHETWHDIDPDTIGQFTGLYDGKGNEIYGNDILVSKCSGVAVGYLEVFWSDDKAAFLVEDYNDDAQTTGNLFYLSEFDTKDYTICGNIHDDPDLLKQA